MGFRLPSRITFFGAIAACLGLALPVAAGELPAGEPIETNGLTVAGIFLQAVDMEPAMKAMASKDTDIHLEADILAAQGNENGFAEGEWMPYLTVTYSLAKAGSDWKTSGELVPMVASDGPHYGANVKLDGPGKYTVLFNISPPSKKGFLRHTDKETGVGKWWDDFEYNGEFNFFGTGKKGGY